MPPAITFKVRDNQFRDALRRYVRVSKSAIPDIVNRKAFFIARRAVIETPTASKMLMDEELGRVFRRKGKLSVRWEAAGAGKWGLRHFKSGDARLEAPLAALIINARRGRKSLPGLFGEAMKQAMAILIAARRKSRAYLKSGWIPAIKRLEQAVKSRRGAPRMESSPRQVGQPKGSAIPATNGFRVRAVIENAVAAAGGRAEHHAEAVKRFGEPALQRAFDRETKSTLDEISRRLNDAAKSVGIKTRG